MSQYINFFIRCDDKFLPLFSFSRNSYMYSAFHARAPFEKISVISEEIINLSKEVLLDQIDTYQRKVTQYEREKTLIPSFDNAVQEKLEELRNIDDLLADIQSELDELGLALNYCAVMHDIIETAKYGEKNIGVSSYKEDSLLYCGIEAGTPTIHDII